MGFFSSIRGVLSKKKTEKQKPHDICTMPFVYRAGVLVTPDTAKTFSAVFRASAIIAQTIGFMPWSVYREREIRREHPAHKLLHMRPSPEMGAMTFKETIVRDALLWGNGYAEIERNRAGEAIALWRLEPSRMRITRDDSGRLAYEYTDAYGEKVLLRPEYVFHLKGLGDGLVGESIVGLAAKSIAAGLAAENLNASLFENQIIPSGVLEHPARLSEEALIRLRDQFKARYGGQDNAGKPVVLEEGMKFTPLTMKPEDVQFLQSRQFQVEEIARWFGVPPHKLADLQHATFSNIEHQSLEFINDALMPWCKRLEEEADYKLLNSQPQGFYSKIDARGLLRGDNKSRMEFYKGGVTSGIFSINECRNWEDLPPIEGGGKHFVQMQMVPVDQIEDIKPVNEPEEGIE